MNKHIFASIIMVFFIQIISAHHFGLAIHPKSIETFEEDGPGYQAKPFLGFHL
ncbi:MAG: hypothetical protein H6573_33790 [Lewinellaceae bacterium]|nr:hypothetical protein [Lewinellaceae bacterium]